MIGSLAGLAACAASPQEHVDTGPHKVSFMVFRAPITAVTRGYFVNAINTAVQNGSTEMRIGMSSPGGNIQAALAMVDDMDRAHADNAMGFTLFDVGLVASAACYVFLAGQRRYAVPRGAFLFHEASLQSTGPITAQRVHEAAARLDEDERRFLAILKARTKLSNGEALSFVRRTVILNADEAARDGITNGTAEFVVPNPVNPIDIRLTSDTSPLPISRPAALPPAPAQPRPA